jgi:hypothetical protein
MENKVTKPRRQIRAWEEYLKNPTCDWTEPILENGVCKATNKCDRPATLLFTMVPEHAPICRCADHADECREMGLTGKKVIRQATSWEELFHTKEEMESASPVSFLIDGFLQREGVTALAAPVRERKSLIALNICHALLTGEKLFDHFEVVQQPERILYLCPEVSLGPFKARLEKIGLMEYVGTTLFCRTLNADGKLSLTDPMLQDGLPGSVVVLDTAVRFLSGDENSSSDVRDFADSIFTLLRNGAEAVLLLHHSPKDSSGDTMTLENAMRGSGDLGAFVACAWGTRLQNPADPYKSTSYLENLKQRDFESRPFEVSCGEDCRMHIVSNPNDPLTVPVKLKSRKNRGTTDGKDAVAIAMLKANPQWSEREAVRELKATGIVRSRDWIREQRYKLRSGVVVETE